jgi:tetratricopeptide (TPR) repeat protein
MSALWSRADDDSWHQLPLPPPPPTPPASPVDEPPSTPVNNPQPQQHFQRPAPPFRPSQNQPQTQPQPQVPAGPTPEQIAAAQAAAAAQARLSQAKAASDQGIASLHNGDFASAEDYFQKAHDLNPNDQNIANNLALAKRLLDQKNATAKATKNMRQVIAEQTQSLPGGGNSDSNTSSSLAFIDPSAVDTRHVASGLPQSVAAAISIGYASAPSGVSDRVRSGYEAVASHDWKAARAWFQDALNHDPGDLGLQRLVDLADHTENYMEQHHLGKVTDSPALGTPVEASSASGLQFVAPGGNSDPASPSTSAGSAVQLPQDSDMDLLFPNLPSREAAELRQYMYQKILESAQNDPGLIEASKRLPAAPPEPPLNQN